MNKSRQLIIEKVAENVRDECNVTDYGFQNIFEAAEKAGYRIIRYPIGSESFLGFALIKETEKIIFSNSSQILSREIFSIAHEMGHHKLHLSEQDKTIIRDDDFSDRDENEIEANYFAACLLMPMEKVIKFKSLRIIDENLLGKLRIEKMEQTTAKLLNAINGNSDLCKSSSAKKIPAEYLEWVISNYAEKLIPKKSLETALNYVDINAEDFENPIDEDTEESFDDLFERMS